MPLFSCKIISLVFCISIEYIFILFIIFVVGLWKYSQAALIGLICGTLALYSLDPEFDRGEELMI